MNYITEEARCQIKNFDTNIVKEAIKSAVRIPAALNLRQEQ